METEILIKRLCSQLGLEYDENPESAVDRIAALFEDCHEILNDRAVQTAIAKGLLEKRDERWAHTFIAEQSLAAFSAFLRYRKCHSFSVPLHAHEPGDLQRKLNSMMGVSREAFLKYGAE